jgi:hypothetical protein
LIEAFAAAGKVRIPSVDVTPSQRVAVAKVA